MFDFLFPDRWKQVYQCSCGIVTKPTSSITQACPGCKQWLSRGNGRIRWARKCNDGTWEFKEG